MKYQVSLFLALAVSLGLTACSNPLGSGKDGSEINDGYKPGAQDPVTPVPQNIGGFYISPGNQLLSAGTTTSAKVGVKVNTRILKGSSTSMAVSINRFESR